MTRIKSLDMQKIYLKQKISPQVCLPMLCYLNIPPPPLSLSLHAFNPFSQSTAQILI